MDQPDASATLQPQQDVGLLFHATNLDTNTALTVTAAHAGIDVNNPQALQQWLDELVGSRRQALDSVRLYHTGVIRTEMYNLITQVEPVVVKRLVTGWDPTMSSEDRHFMQSWLFQQVQFIRTWCEHRGLTNLDQDQVLFQVLQVDPTSPPSGDPVYNHCPDF